MILQKKFQKFWGTLYRIHLLWETRLNSQLKIRITLSRLFSYCPTVGVFYIRCIYILYRIQPLCSPQWVYSM